MHRRFSWNLIWQPFLAVIYIGIVLALLSHFESTAVVWAIGAGSLSSSSCIVFASPNSKSASSKNITIGYLIGTGLGVLIHILFIKFIPLFTSGSTLFHSNGFWAFASVAVGMAMIIMILCDVLNPPAVGMSLILVLDIEHYGIIVIILFAALTLALLRHLLNPYLKDLTA